MPKHLEVHKLSNTSGDVALVRLLDKKLINLAIIKETADELTALVDEGHTKLVIAFANVEGIISPVMNALIKLKQKLDAKSGALRLCTMKDLVHGQFTDTHLDRVFTIKATENEALADF